MTNDPTTLLAIFAVLFAGGWLMSWLNESDEEPV